MTAEILYTDEWTTSTARLRLRSDNIVEMEFPDNTFVDESAQLENNQLISEVLGNERKYGLLVKAGHFYSRSPGASALAREFESRSPFCCVAIIARNLPQRILANFYLTVMKPEIPMRLVTNRESGIRWCLRKMEESRRETLRPKE